jgi:hypothetical protein
MMTGWDHPNLPRANRTRHIYISSEHITAIRARPVVFTRALWRLRSKTRRDAAREAAVRGAGSPVAARP